MNMKLAAQVFSHSVAPGLCFLSAVGRLRALASHTADFCSNVNKLFDSLKSRKINHNNPFLSAVSKNSIHMETWVQMLDLIKSIEFQTKKKISFPSLFGWRLTLSAFQHLIPILLENVPFILMCRFTQDALENFFSVVRRRGGNNDHPTAYDFQQRMRFLMAQNVISISRLSNCEPDHDTVLIPAEVLTVNKNSEPVFGDEENELEIDFDDLLLPLTETAGNAVDIPTAGAVHYVFEQNSSAYVAGYIAQRALKVSFVPVVQKCSCFK
ncbi:Transposable element P transposase, partial [Stegodyphus mimosarum]